MSRRALVVLVAGLAWAAGLTAQNEPFLGTWELNLAKSSITRGAPPRMGTVVPEPGGFRSTLAVVGATATSVEVHHYNFDGNFHQTEGSDPREPSFKRVDPDTIEQDTRRNGQITASATPRAGAGLGSESTPAHPGRGGLAGVRRSRATSRRAGFRVAATWQPTQ
jgi:hypothetical protein